MNKVLLLLFLMLSIQAFSQTATQINETKQIDLVAELKTKIKKYDIVKLPVEEYLDRLSVFDGPLEMVVKLGENDVIPLQLIPENDLVDRQVIHSASKGVMKNSELKVFPYSGFVQNGSAYSRLTIAEDFFYLYVQGENFSRFVEPLRYVVPGADHDLYIVYYGKDVIMPKGNFCASNALKQAVKEVEPQQEKSVVGLCFETEIALASDFLMYQKYNSDIDDVIARNVGVMNNVQGNYDDEFADEIQFVIVEQYVSDCSTCDPWSNSTDSGTLLTSFRNWGPNGFSQVHDLGHLWSNRDFDGGTIGLAYVGVICTGSRYAVLQDFSSNANLIRVLTSHEAGHNFDALHDAAGSGFIMAPSVNNSTTWSGPSISDIESHYLSRTCLAACAPPAPPVSNFTANLTEICPGSTIQFFDQTENSPTTWDWTFPGGTPSSSTMENPVVTYNNSGVYNVTLITTNDSGTDSETKNGYIVVSNSGFEFVLSDDFSSGLNNWNVTNPDNSTSWETAIVGGSSGSGNVAWINNYDYSDGVGDLDGLESAVIDFTGRDIITLELEYAYARYNANNNDRFRILASTNGGASFTDLLFEGFENGSGNFATVPQMTQPFTPINESEWCIATTFGPNCISLDLSQYADEQEFVLRLENESDYGNNLYLDNVNILTSCFVNEPPIANLTSDVTSGCSPLLVNFQDLSLNSPDSWQWTFPGGTPSSSTNQNPTVIYQDAGVYPVTLVVTNEAGTNEAVLSNYITVLDVPEADFFTDINGPTVSFINNSNGGDSYTWDFGNNQSSTMENPVHTYTEDGTYMVTLIVTNICGTTSYSQMIEIATEPFANFSQDVTQGCADLVVQYTNTSSSNSDSFEWSFPGGTPSSSTEENPTVTYVERGVYNTTLTAFNETGENTYTLNAAVIVNDVPTTSFNFTLDDNTVTFDNTTEFGDTYVWDFGDNETSTDENPIHTYDGDGQYTVTLHATNACGTFTVTQELSISNLPFANFNAPITEGCADFIVEFENNSSSNAETFEWIFEGGTPATSTDENPVVEYTQAGSYNVQLIVGNEEGTDELTIENYITVGDVPQADYSYTNNDLVFSFTNESIDGSTYLWDFGDNETSSMENPVHTYDEDGTYTVTLTVTNDCGSDEFILEVTAVTAVTAGFAVANTEGCVDFEVQFSNTSSSNATDFLWSFPGGVPSTSTEEEPVVIYSSTGSYTVSLIASNDGFSDEVSLMNYITVNDVPEPSFTNISNMFTVEFTNTTMNATSYLWDFGDMNTSALVNPIHTYNELGDYVVTLTAFNECGEAIIENDVVVSVLPVANFSSNVTSGCTVAEIQFEDLSSSNATEWMWTFEGGNPATSSEQNPVVEYAADGVFDVSLTVSNESGTDTQTFDDYISIQTLPIVQILNSTDGNVVTFDVDSDNAEEYVWTVQDTGEQYEGKFQEITFPADGVYAVTLQATNDCGTISVTTAVNITAYPDAGFNSGFSEGCAPAIIEFEDDSQDGPFTYQWTFEGGSPSTSTDENPVVEYNEMGMYDVELIVENQYGSDTLYSEQFISLTEGPEANFDYATMGAEVDFTNTSTGEGTVTWDFGDDSGSTEENPTHTYDVTGDYLVTLIIDNGLNCQDTIQRLVSVIVNSLNEFQDAQVGLYPNPNEGVFTLSIISSTSSTYNYTILDVTGRVIEKGRFINSGEQFNKEFTLDVSAGLYFLKLQKGEEQKVVRFVKQ